MQAFWTSLLAVLVYLSSALGFAPAGGAVGSPHSSDGVSPSAGAAPVSAVYRGSIEVMGYYAERWPGDAAAYQSLQRAASSLTTVIPFAYELLPDGRIKGGVNGSLLQLARNHGLKVLALVHNAGSGNFDPASIHALLEDPPARQRAIDNLLNLLVEEGLDGLNLDLERVSPGDHLLLTGFVRDLSARLRARHFLLTASLPAKTGTDTSSTWAGAYDYAGLNPYLDQVILMAYDQHVPGGKPGPVAALPWVEAVVRYALTAFSRQKVVLGLPAYGYVYTLRGGRAINYAQANTIIRRSGTLSAWDYTAQVPRFTYQQNGAICQAWYEDSRSAGRKTDLAVRYGLRGVAIWRLGYEDPALWPVLAAKLR